MCTPCAATRRWFVVVLLAVAALAAPAVGSAKPQKAIVISISQQMLWAYKGNQKPIGERKYALRRRKWRPVGRGVAGC